MSMPEYASTSIHIYLENSWKLFRNDPFSDQSIDFARLIAAYYLGFPLFTPKNSGSFPSLYEWPKSLSEINLDEAVLLKRIDVAKTISTICDERTPPVLLWVSDHHIEAIYYCDQFRDLKSQAMLRFLEEQLSGLKLLQMFCESRIEMAFNELDNLGEIKEYGIVQNMQSLWGKLVDSLLQMDAITDTRTVNLLIDRILGKMCNIHAMMPLFVNVNISLPRPPVYMCTTFIGFEEEQYCYIRLWILIQTYARLLSDANVLLICIEHFCWNFLEINGECEYFDRKFLRKDHYQKSRTKSISFWIRGFLKFILIILRLIARDAATIEHRNGFVSNNQIKNATAKYYDLLNVEEDNDDDDLLVKWMKEADQSDFEQINHLFDYLSTFRSSFTHMNEFSIENITFWRNHLLKEVILQEGVNRNEMQQNLQINAVKTKVSDGVLVKAEYIARCWSYPTFAADEGLLAMNLKLCPSDFVHGTTSNTATPSLKRTPVIEFAPRTCRHSSFDIRPYSQQSVTVTSRSFPIIRHHLKSADTPDTSRMNSWRKLDNTMQKVNVMIDEVEEELRSASSYMKTLMNSRRKILTENSTSFSGSDPKSCSDSSSLLSQKSETSFVAKQCKFVNDDRYSLDSNREPECHSEIEKLNFDLLSPQPSVRNTAVVNTISALASNTLPPSPVMSDSQHSSTIPSPLPAWLKLLPIKQKNFLLSLTPTIDQMKESQEDDSVQEIQLPEIKLLTVTDEEKQSSPNNLKFELVTTIASNPQYD
ncbi:Neuraminidase [Dirofilaria immitis]